MRSVSLFLLVLGVDWCVGIPAWYAQSPQDVLEPIVVEHIQRAQQRLWIVQYRLTSAPCVHALVAAKQRGVDVRVILDRGMHQSPAYYFVSKTLRKAGIPIWWLGPVPLCHHKSAIIDNQVLTGSANWTRAGLSTNAEGFVALDEASLVQGYVSHYVTLMRRAAGFTEYTQQQSARLFFIPDNAKALNHALKNALRAATRRIWIAMYSFTASWCWQLLAAAVERGVDVQVLLEPSQIDEELLRQFVKTQGIAVRFHKGAHGILHHKLAIIDDEVWYGSMNWTGAGMRSNQENVVRIPEGFITQSVVETFKQLWAL